MSEPKDILGPMRLPFIILTPACVLLGLGTAVWTTGRIVALHFILALVGAVCAHISVNAFNEYFDFKSGLDARTHPTPFSGGSGTLPAKPSVARYALITAVTASAITALIGVTFMMVRGWSILPLGLMGLFIVVAYTPWLAHNAFLCLIAPGLGFGPLMVMGTHLALTGTYSWVAFVASLIPFFLVSDLLLLNQFPDVEADRSVGRVNYPVVLGKRTSSLIYGAFLFLTYLTIVLGVVLKIFPPASLLGLLTVVAAVPAALNAHRFAENVPKLIPAMGMNVIINIATPALVAVGLLIG